MSISVQNYKVMVLSGTLLKLFWLNKPNLNFSKNLEMESECYLLGWDLWTPEWATRKHDGVEVVQDNENTVPSVLDSIFIESGTRKLKTFISAYLNQYRNTWILTSFFCCFSYKGCPVPVLFPWILFLALNSILWEGVMQRSVPQAKEVQEKILQYDINNVYIGYCLLYAEFLSTA